MEKINETEQWLLNGECSKCRRQNYCSKPCTKYTRGMEREMRSLISDMLDNVTGGAYGELMKHSKYK